MDISLSDRLWIRKNFVNSFMGDNCLPGELGDSVGSGLIKFEWITHLCLRVYAKWVKILIKSGKIEGKQHVDGRKKLYLLMSIAELLFTLLKTYLY